MLSALLPERLERQQPHRWDSAIQVREVSEQGTTHTVNTSTHVPNVCTDTHAHTGVHPSSLKGKTRDSAQDRANRKDEEKGSDWLTRGVFVSLVLPGCSAPFPLFPLRALV
ncbi:non-structural maintenance of chromosomes element 1-like protein [Platysternon megacephalum]|uniref:Non-structural maintenance of chromosomes element 1-like protein n=1 Tax=Platysternon megacephalum TaxID=55544 RepID=A0A4D9EJN7_9SAUR|nr:non-structural maintenance of chromosomes element 1-like protein [Platysternon megacephalum]